MGRLIGPLLLMALTIEGAAAEETRQAISPDGKTIAFVRPGAERSEPGCAGKPDEIWRKSADGSAEKLLLRGREGRRREEALCGFTDLQFSSDGRRLLFVSEAWVTSGAVHEIDMTTGRERYLLPGNGLVILAFCKGENKDLIAVEQHRYFRFGGSYDWYWLFSPDGRKELGPLGEFGSREEVMRAAREDWCS